MKDIYNEYATNLESRDDLIKLIDVDLTFTESDSQLFAKLRPILSNIDIKKEHEIVLFFVGNVNNNLEKKWDDFINFINEKSQLGFKFSLIVRGTVHLRTHLPILNYTGVTLHHKLKIVWDVDSNREIINHLKHNETKLQTYFKYFAKELVDYKTISLNTDCLANFEITEFNSF